MMAPVPFIQLFKYASREDLILLGIANLLIVYSSINIPLVNIVYGLMMREMNDFVARRAQFVNNTISTIATTTTISPLIVSSSSSMTDNLTTPLSTILLDSSNETFRVPIQRFNGTFEDAKETFINESYNLCLIVIVFGLTRFIALYLALLFFSRAAANQAKRVKALFFRSLLRQEVAWFERNRTGDFAIRITSDLSKFEDGIGEKIALCLNALFAWISSLISSFYYGWELTLVCLVLVPLTIFITTVIAEFQASYSIKESSALSRAFNICHEVISSIRTVLAFSGQDKEAQRFKIGLDSAYKYGLKRNMFAGLNLGFTWMSGYLGFAICLLYSTKFYKPEYFGHYDEAHIITILWSAAGCVFLLNRMMPFIEIIQMARGSASNLFTVIERKSQIDVTSEDGLKPLFFEANVSFSNVSFNYPNSQPIGIPPSAVTADRLQAAESGTGAGNKSTGCQITEENEEELLAEAAEGNLENQCDVDDEELLSGGEQLEDQLEDQPGGGNRYTIRNMSMEVKSGQTIALVGPSGSGKSTALALLQRFYELDEGSITLGGHQLSELNLGWLRSQFGVVTQEPVLFDLSIADNIRLGARPGQCVSHGDIEEAARSANAHSFISRLPLGYETRAGARGIQLSGGQKQRIAIARALIRQPKLLLLDEATSALDLESESIVQRALDRARVGRTTFVVAHRLSTVKTADQIIVFDRGTIVESGTHDELLAKRGLYHSINAQQKQGFDLVPSVVVPPPPPPSNGAIATSTTTTTAAAATMAAATRRSSLVGTVEVGGGALASSVGVSSGSGAFGAPAEGDPYTTRGARSLSIYSATGKYAPSGGGLGAAGHGGNGENVDSADCAGLGEPDPVQGTFATDDDYYNRNETDDEDEDSSDVASSLVVSTTTKENNNNNNKTGSTRLLIGATNEETQASLLDAESTGFVINAKGKKVNTLSAWRVLKFIKPDWAYSLVGIVASLLMGLCIPISAMIIGDIATIFATDRPEQIRHGLYTHGLMYTGLALFAFAISFVQVLAFGLAGEKIGIHLRLRGFQAIMGRELAWFDHKRNNPGSICARLASDVGNVQSITGNRTAVIFQSISILVSTFVFAVYFNLKFSAICVLFVAILLISTVMQARYSGKLALANRSFDSQIGKIVLESSANIKTLVSLHQEDYFVDRCEQLLNKDQRSLSLDNHLRLSLESLKYAMTAISKGASFYFAAGMLVRDEISIDVIFKLIEIILYGLTEASKSLIFLSDLEKARRGTQNLYKLIYNHKMSSSLLDYSAPGGGASGQTNKKQKKQKRYLPSLLLPNRRQLQQHGYKSLPSGEGYLNHSVANNNNNNNSQQAPKTDSLAIGGANQFEDNYEQFMSMLKCEGQLHFDSVRFNYPSRPEACVLKSLSLRIPAGKTVALVGRSGCGKSTLVSLLEKFYHKSQGHILLDGTDLDKLPTEWVRRQIGLVSQEPSLLSYTIGDNIRYGDNSRFVPHEEVVRAAQVANIHDFIMSLPDGYDTKLSESNSLQLSGGQKQRIAIARALVRQAPIMLFDEATSALDSKSEHVVQAALDRARAGKTSIIIAHRLSTIKQADQIVVLRDGLVVEQGSHAELLDKRGEYYCLYKTQSKF